MRAGYCGSYSADYNTTYGCAVTASSTVIKFSARLRLTARRLYGVDRKKVRFTARVARFDDIDGTKPVTTKVAIRLYRGHGRWRTIHTATARGRAGYTWTYKHTKEARFRAIARESSTTFTRTSTMLRR